MSPTIYDIARVAGVSKSTVSRVLNKQTNISPGSAAKKCYGHWRITVSTKQAGPRATSSVLCHYGDSTRLTKTTAGNPFFSEVLHAITAKAEEEGFDVILQTSHNPAEDLQKCESKIKQKMIKGIIMLSSPADESFFAQLDKYEMPGGGDR